MIHGRRDILFSIMVENITKFREITCPDQAMRPHHKRWVNFDVVVVLSMNIEHPGDEWQVASQFDLERDDLFIRQANTFLDAIEGHGSMGCPLDAGHQTLKATLAILKSVETRTWQSIDESGRSEA